MMPSGYFLTESPDVGTHRVVGVHLICLHFAPCPGWAVVALRAGAQETVAHGVGTRFVHVVLHTRFLFLAHRL